MMVSNKAQILTTILITIATPIMTRETIPMILMIAAAQLMMVKQGTLMMKM